MGASDGCSLSLETLMAMDALYKFSTSKNAEIRFKWQMLCISSEASFILPQVETFLKEQGRMKFIRPLFRALGKKNADTRAVALRVFEEWKCNYHPIAQKMIAKDLAPEE